MEISNTAILFFVCSAFCDSVKEKIWNEYGLLLTAQILLCVVVLFAAVSLLIYLATHLARLNREDAIACYFCSVKKTLAMGIPLAILIFGSRPDLSLILLPIMFYIPSSSSRTGSWQTTGQNNVERGRDRDMSLNFASV